MCWTTREREKFEIAFISNVSLLHITIKRGKGNLKLTWPAMTKKRDFQRKPVHTMAWSSQFYSAPVRFFTMTSALQYACHARLTGGTAVGSRGSWFRHAFLSLSAHTNTHLDENTHTDTLPRPARPPAWAGWPPKQLQLPGTDRQTD